LLATDLSARSDRALDRAAELALRWNAELLVVHALEHENISAPEYRGLPAWRRPPNDPAKIERQIRDDVRGDCPALRVHVEEGPAVGVILDAVERHACDLVVLGLGRARTLGALGRTIDELFRRSPVSVLVVKRRPREPYRHVLVGTDLSPEARHGLEVAAAMFPEAMFVLMHAFDMPYRSLVPEAQLSQHLGEMEGAQLKQSVDEAALPEPVRAHLLTLIEHGPPELMLSTYVSEHAVDLTVIGAYERSRLFHAVVGGNGPGIVAAVPTDVMVVRAPRG
jgi:nucleotide-binding universal stress UspA family protein